MKLGLGLGELCEMIGFLLPESSPRRSAKGARIGGRRTEHWPTEHTEPKEEFLQEGTERTEGGQRPADVGVGVLSQRPRSADTEEAGDGQTESPSGFLPRIDLGLSPVHQIGEVFFTGDGSVISGWLLVIGGQPG